MSTTLTNGLKLPDKGSVDWYADMQNNYQILDGAVGTVAEHTTALAGKAPLVHTHTKSDVTDLLNSNFVPSSNGSYNLGSLANRWGTVYGIESNVRSDKIDFTDTTTTGTKAHWHLSNAEKNGSTFFQIGSQRNHSAGLNEEHFRIKNANDKWADLYIQLDDSNQFSIGTTTHSDVTNNGFKGKFTPFDSFIPYTNNSYNLGSSGKQWNNLYAKKVNTQSVNGINPGVLSLPDLTNNGYIELSDNISANTEYSYTPPADGWLALYVLTTGFHVENAVGIFNGSGSGNAHRLACSATSGINLARSNYYHGAVILPVIAGIPYLCWIKIDSSTTLASKVLYFYKAAGNV